MLSIIGVSGTRTIAGRVRIGCYWAGAGTVERTLVFLNGHQYACSRQPGKQPHPFDTRHIHDGQHHLAVKALVRTGPHAAIWETAEQTVWVGNHSFPPWRIRDHWEVGVVDTGSAMIDSLIWSVHRDTAAVWDTGVTVADSVVGSLTRSLDEPGEMTDTTAITPTRVCADTAVAISGATQRGISRRIADTAILHSDAITAFPDYPLLDDFERASLGANWSSVTGLSDLAIVDSHYLTGSSSGFCGGRWNVETYSNLKGRVEVLQFDEDDLDQTVELGFLTDAVWSARTGYRLALFRQSTVSIYRCDDGTDVLLASWYPDWADGDAVGFSYIDDRLTAYRRPVGGAWYEIGHVHDATYMGDALYLVVRTHGTVVRLDNLRGGGRPHRTTNDPGVTFSDAVASHRTRDLADTGSFFGQPALFPSATSYPGAETYTAASDSVTATKS
jgi:hypothetical protein